MTTPTESATEASPIRRSADAREWTERCGTLFEALRGPARAMLFRSFGSVLSEEEIEDVYSSAWAASLSALRGREQRLDDDELRAYVLTAVASHARKELRRRSRKPTSALDDAHAQVLADGHDPLPDERTIDAESGTITRDVLGTLPPRRRAVLLLRYGWGLQPAEICALVANLSPRAYRKEITRGVEQMVERLKQVETGEWCAGREPVLRDYVAGTAGEDVQRQALQHMAHCRHCSEFVSRLTNSLHDLGSSVAWASVAGVIGEDKVSLADRIGGVLDGVEGLAGRADAATADAATGLAASGGARGAGAAGTGVLAKLAGLGTAGKAAIACFGAGAAATACVATGVVPGVELPWSAGPPAREAGHEAGPPGAAQPSPLTSVPSTNAVMEVATGGQQGGPGGEGDGDKPGGDGSKTEPVETAPEGAPASSPAPTAPPVEQQFVVPSAATTDTASGGGTAGGGGTSAGSGASGGDIGKEFGP